jgi:hypothetical protein
MASLKVFLDDERMAPPGWIRIASAESAADILRNNAVESLSLDHDLGEGKPTGYDLVKIMAEEGLWPKNKPMVHSANPAGAESMQKTIDRYGPYE